MSTKAPKKNLRTHSTSLINHNTTGRWKVTQAVINISSLLYFNIEYINHVRSSVELDNFLVFPNNNIITK